MANEENRIKIIKTNRKRNIYILYSLVCVFAECSYRRCVFVAFVASLLGHVYKMQWNGNTLSDEVNGSRLTAVCTVYTVNGTLHNRSIR